MNKRIIRKLCIYPAIAVLLFAAFFIFTGCEAPADVTADEGLSPSKVVVNIDKESESILPIDNSTETQEPEIETPEDETEIETPTETNTEQENVTQTPAEEEPIQDPVVEEPMGDSVTASPTEDEPTGDEFTEDEFIEEIDSTDEQEDEIIEQQPEDVGMGDDLQSPAFVFTYTTEDNRENIEYDFTNRVITLPLDASYLIFNVNIAELETKYFSIELSDNSFVGDVGDVSQGVIYISINKTGAFTITITENESGISEQITITIE